VGRLSTRKKYQLVIGIHKKAWKEPELEYEAVSPSRSASPSPPPLPPPADFGLAGPPNRKKLAENAASYRKFMKWISDGAVEARQLAKTRLIQQPKRKDPGNFDGSSKDFRSWWLSVLQYMDYTKSDFESDSQKISWIGGFWKDKALVWHQTRWESF